MKQLKQLKITIRIMIIIILLTFKSEWHYIQEIYNHLSPIIKIMISEPKSNNNGKDYSEGISVLQICILTSHN